MPEQRDVITFRDVTKTFGSRTIVNLISFSVAQGEVFGILGANGAGKTSAMDRIEGLHCSRRWSSPT